MKSNRFVMSECAMIPLFDKACGNDSEACAGRSRSTTATEELDEQCLDSRSCAMTSDSVQASTGFLGVPEREHAGESTSTISDMAGMHDTYLL